MLSHRRRQHARWWILSYDVSSQPFALGTLFPVASHGWSNNVFGGIGFAKFARNATAGQMSPTSTQAHHGAPAMIAAITCGPDSRMQADTCVSCVLHAALRRRTRRVIRPEESASLFLVSISYFASSVGCSKRSAEKEDASSESESMASHHHASSMSVAARCSGQSTPRRVVPRRRNDRRPSRALIPQPPEAMTRNASRTVSVLLPIRGSRIAVSSSPLHALRRLFS